jgi:CBS domain-containing protein
MHHVTVKDVMTWRVISVGEDACFKDIAEVLHAHAVSALPVVDDDGHVVGVVSEADLLHKEELREQFLGEDYRPHTPSVQELCAGKARGEVARELMSAPAAVVSMDASVVTACRLMEDRGVKRLPVVDEHGRLVGIVSRCDLLKVFIRSDHDIEHEVRVDVLVRSLWMDTSRVAVAVKDGVVTLSGRVTLRRDAEIAVWMTRQVNGVVNVIDELAWDRDNTPTGERH